MAVRVVVGDVTAVTDRPVILAHVCNNVGGWGAGFSGVLSKKWPVVETSYREWHASGDGFFLGAGQLVPTDFGMQVANLVAQDGFGRDGKRYLDYEALMDCLLWLGSETDPEIPVVMPKIGAGLGGGDWERISLMINHVLSDRVTVYELPTKKR